MKKIILLAFYVIMITLTGCSSGETSEQDSLKESIAEIPTQTEISIEKITEKVTEKAAETKSTETTPKETIYKTDNNSANNWIYESVLKKIWIIKNTDSFKPSIYITKIENGIIEGKWSLELILPDCYTESFEPSITYGSFEGTIDSGYAKCKFSDKTETGTFDLLLHENDTIETNIKFTKKAYNDKEYPEGSYIFEPYKIGDFGESDSDKIRSYPVNLDSWGKVNLTTRYINAHHPYSAAYLTDDDNNILYEFKGLSNGWEIGDVSIEDVNDDGLKDITIKLDSPLELIYIFIQMENGLFYDSKLDPDPYISNLAPLP